MELSPEKIYDDIKAGNLDKTSAIESLISIVENSDNDDIRVKSLEILEKIEVNSDLVFKFLENLMISDSSVKIRNTAASFVKKHFQDRALNIMKWALKYEMDYDILVTIFHGNKVLWYENRGNKSFQEHVIDNDCRQAVCVHGTDLDNDGDLDIIASSVVEGIFYYENLGNNYFEQFLLNESIVDCSTIIPVDVNNDSLIDIVGARRTSITALWINHGNFSFTRHTLTDNPNMVRYLCSADLDNDKDVDIIFGYRKLNKGMPLILKFGNWFINRVIEFLYNIKYSDLYDTLIEGGKN